MRAQGALEYLIIIAAVLGISAVVVLFISGTFTATSSGADVALCRQTTANCANRLATGVSTSCPECDTNCEGSYIDLCKTGATSRVTGGTIASYLSTGVNEKSASIICSPSVYIIENDKTKFFISTPPIYDLSCAVISTWPNSIYYTMSPVRIWSKNLVTTYRNDSTVLDNTYFLLYDPAAHYLIANSLSDFEVTPGQITVSASTSPVSSYFDAKVIYTLYPGNVNYVKITLWAKNKGTSARSVYFVWSGDQDPYVGTWYDEEGETCTNPVLPSCADGGGNQCGKTIYASKWVTFVRSTSCGGVNNDVYGIIAPNAADFHIGFSSEPYVRTVPLMINPGEEYKYSFYLVSDAKGPAGQEWKPIEDAYNSIFGA